MFITLEIRAAKTCPDSSSLVHYIQLEVRNNPPAEQFELYSYKRLHDKDVISIHLGRKERLF
jgi:hypothetical protein